MGIFDRIKKGSKVKLSDASAKKPRVSRKPKANTDTGIETVLPERNVPVRGGVFYEGIILKKPHVSEKAHNLSLSNKYVFIVANNATKPQVREAVRRHFGVYPLHVNMTVKKTKGKRYYSSVSPVHTIKKATVVLKPGDKIDVFTA